MTAARARYVLAGLLLVSTVLRLVFFLQLRGTDLAIMPLLDASTYHEWALRLVSGDPGWNETYWMGPLYPHLLALAYLAFGVGSEPVFLLQLALSVLNIHLVYRLGLFAFDGRPRTQEGALLAAGLFAFYGPPVFYAGMLLMTTVTTTLVLVVALQAFRCVAAPAPHRWFVLGLLVGLAGLSRGNILILLAAFPVLLLKVVPGTLPVRRKSIVLLVVGGLLVLAPVTLRNLIVARDMTLLTSNGGLNLYIGQQADHKGIFAPADEEAQAEADFSMEETLEREMGRDLKGSEISRILARRAWDLFVDDIDRMPAHYFRKAYRFWNGYELPQIVAYDHWRGEFAALRFLPVPFVFLSACGLLGLVFLPRRVRWIVGPMLAAYFLSIWPFFPTARYRMPITPLLALSAAAFVIGIVRARDWRWLAAAVLGIVLLWPRWAAIPDEEVAWQVHMNAASRAAKLGKAEVVRTNGRAAEDVRPGLAETPFRVAYYLEEVNDLDGALAALGEAERRAPQNRLIPYRSGRFLEDAGRNEAAIAAFERAMELDPDWAYPCLRAGLVRNRQGRKDEAVAFMERAHELDPGHRRIRANLASLYAETGRTDEARRMLEDLVRDHPNYVNGWFNLAVFNLQMGNAAAARRALDRAEALHGLDENQKRQIAQLRQVLDGRPGR